MATTRKKNGVRKRGARKGPSKSASGTPQLSAAQKEVLRQQYEQMQSAKVDVANMVMQLDRMEAELQKRKDAAAETERKFTETCRSALQGVGIDLEDPTKAYTVDVADMSVKETPRRSRPASA